MLDAGGLLQPFIKETEDTAGDKKGAEIANGDQGRYDDDEAEAVILNMNHALVIRMSENGYPAVDGGDHKINGIGRYGHRSQDQQALEKILQKLLVMKRPFHDGVVLM